jgi:hypothetical protein
MSLFLGANYSLRTNRTSSRSRGLHNDREQGQQHDHGLLPVGRRLARSIAKSKLTRKGRGDLGSIRLHGHDELATCRLSSSREKRLWASITGAISTVVICPLSTTTRPSITV